MAHVAVINELAESLVAASTGCTRDQPRFNRLHNEATKGLRVSSYARTNQFDVRSKLEGLVEKFVVLNRDDLAEELQRRLDQLPTKSKWLPEILSLLLLLSDRPAEKAHVEDLAAINEAPRDDQVLSWKEVFDDDPLEENGLWDDVDHGYHSSGDEATGDEEDLTTSTIATSVGDQDLVTLAGRHIVTPDNHALDEVRSYRTRLLDEPSNNSTLSELTIIRETLAMLQGLPTSIYIVDNSSGKVLPNPRYTLDTATQSILTHMLTRCADMGSSLNNIRAWLQIESKVLYLQSCQAAINGLLVDLKARLARIEQRYLSPQEDDVVSFIDVQSEVEPLVRPALHLSTLVGRSIGLSLNSSFALLDLLYDQTCIAQVTGDVQLTTALSHILFAGLRTYLKPISAWVRDGVIIDTGSFFVFEANDGYELGKMWNERFAMRTLPNGQPAVPKFMQSLAGKLFAIGKSRAFRTALDDGSEEVHETSPAHPHLSWCGDQLSSTEYSPFSQVLDDKLNAWLVGVGRDCTPLLCNTLLYQHRLLDTLNGLCDIFCSRENRLFQAFADTLFWRMDAGRGWRDRFLLTELAQSTLGSTRSISATTLTIIVDGDESDLPTSPISQLATLRLEMLFPWPLQNITRSISPVSYSRAFTFLLQVYRAKYLLRQRIFALRTLNSRPKQLSHSVSGALRLQQALTTMVDILHSHITNTASVLSAAARTNMESADGIDAMANIWKDHEMELQASLFLTANLKLLRDAILNILQLCEHDLWNALVGEVGLMTGDDAGPGAESAEDVRGSKASLTLRTLHTLQSDLEKSLSFLAAGLRATSRAAGNAVLEALADRLEWRITR